MCNLHTITISVPLLIKACLTFDMWLNFNFMQLAFSVSLWLIFLRMSPWFGGCRRRSCSDTDLILPHLLNSHLGPVCFHNCLSLFVYQLSFRLGDCRRPPCHLCQSKLLISTQSSPSTKHTAKHCFQWHLQLNITMFLLTEVCKQSDCMPNSCRPALVLCYKNLANYLNSNN